jgi:hypothetical protein
MLANLDLDDLELDDGDAAAFGASGPAASVPVPDNAPSVPGFATTATSAGGGAVALDPTTPLFFPIPRTSFAEFNAPATLTAKGKRPARALDPLAAAHAAGRHWRQGFFCTETEEEIRAKWEAQKVDLTRSWKRRHREAGKARKRRGGPED